MLLLTLLDLVSRLLFTGCWLCVDAEFAIGQCRLGVRARNLWSEQPLAPPAEDVMAGLEFLVDLPMSLVDQQDKTKKAKMKMRFYWARFYSKR